MITGLFDVDASMRDCAMTAQLCRDVSHRYRHSPQVPNRYCRHFLIVSSHDIMCHLTTQFNITS